ncbi:RNA-splicing ligase RtcB [Clostridium sardiniense]|nr:RNA-splicing ligase RtcB [Clostridium sardiniense]
MKRNKLLHISIFNRIKYKIADIKQKYYIQRDIRKGNEDWNYSAPHGAGRILSRGKAKERVSLDEFKKFMEGIWSTSVCESTIDESPMSYKPIEYILDNIGETIEIIDIIKPVYNLKSSM